MIELWHVDGIVPEQPLYAWKLRKAILEALPQVRLLGIDRDAIALQAAKQRLGIYQERLSLCWLSIETKSWMAAVYTAFSGSIEIQEVPKATAPPGGLLLRVKACGVCRSDYHGWKGLDSDIVTHGLPFTPGTTKFQVGDRVAAQAQPGFTMPGGFAEFVSIPRADRNVSLMPPKVSFLQAAALGCRMTTAFRAVIQQGRLQAGETVAIFGCGGLGLAAVMIAAAAGDNVRILAVDTSDEACKKAIELGAWHAFDAKEGNDHVRAKIAEVTGGMGADLTLDAAGFAESCENAVWCTRRGGRSLAEVLCRCCRLPLPVFVDFKPRISMVQVGLLLHGKEPAIPMARVAGQEIEIIGSHGLAASDMPVLLSMVASGKLLPEKLVTRRLAANTDHHRPAVQILAARVRLVQGNFAEFPSFLQNIFTDERPTCHGLLADLGVSSPQLDCFDRGFSFRGDGPLDMRMDTMDERVHTAAWHISHSQPKQLAKCICDFGDEEPAFAKLVAEALCNAKPQRTREAVEIIEECARQASMTPGKVHVATKTFQALRILVNGELGALETLLANAEQYLAPGGLMAIITFHSLEDDLVRRKVRGEALARGSHEMSRSSVWIPAGSREGLRPSDAEVARNARSRSARLRLAVRAGRTPPLRIEQNGFSCTFVLDCCHLKCFKYSSKFYKIVGTWDDFKGNEMQWDGANFFFIVTLSSQALVISQIQLEWDSFQILEDGSWERTLYPSCRDGNPFVQHQLMGPDGKGHGRNWTGTQLRWTIGRHEEDAGKVELRPDMVGRPSSVTWRRLREAEAESLRQQAAVMASISFLDISNHHDCSVLALSQCQFPAFACVSPFLDCPYRLPQNDWFNHA
eukprot:s504_g12.t1